MILVFYRWYFGFSIRSLGRNYIFALTFIKLICKQFALSLDIIFLLSVILMEFANSTCCTARYIDWLQVPQGDLVHEKNWNEQHTKNLAELYYFSLEKVYFCISLMRYFIVSYATRRTFLLYHSRILIMVERNTIYIRRERFKISLLLTI